MYCIFCQRTDTEVIETRLSEDKTRWENGILKACEKTTVTAQQVDLEDFEKELKKLL